MILYVGAHVCWGAPEVIYLEGKVISLDEQAQTVVVHVERATLHSAHLIGLDIPFTANGLTLFSGDSPPGTTDERLAEPLPPREMTDDEKVLSAAAAAVHQQYGYNLPSEKEQFMIQQVAQVLNSDSAMRTQIITSMNEILKSQF